MNYIEYCQYMNFNLNIFKYFLIKIAKEYNLNLKFILKVDFSETRIVFSLLDESHIMIFNNDIRFKYKKYSRYMKLKNIIYE